MIGGARTFAAHVCFVGDVKRFHFKHEYSTRHVQLKYRNKVGTCDKAVLDYHVFELIGTSYIHCRC